MAMIDGVCMECDCHIISKYLVFQMKNLVSQSKTLDFQKFQNTRFFTPWLPAPRRLLCPLVVFVYCKCLDWTVTKRQYTGLKKLQLIQILIKMWL